MLSCFIWGLRESFRFNFFIVTFFACSERFRDSWLLRVPKLAKNCCMGHFCLYVTNILQSLYLALPLSRLYLEWSHHPIETTFADPETKAKDGWLFIYSKLGLGTAVIAEVAPEEKSYPAATLPNGKEISHYFFICLAIKLFKSTLASHVRCG